MRRRQPCLVQELMVFLSSQPGETMDGSHRDKNDRRPVILILHAMIRVMSISVVSGIVIAWTDTGSGDHSTLLMTPPSRAEVKTPTDPRS